MQSRERVATITGASVALITASAGFFPAFAGAVAPQGDIVPKPSIRACDHIGDMASADDCVRHEYRGTASESNRIRGIDTLSEDIFVSPAFRGRRVYAEVQFRKMKGSKPAGAWTTRRAYVWGDDEKSEGSHHVEVCAPTTVGEYQTRVRLSTAPPRTLAQRSRLMVASVSPSPSASSTPTSTTPSTSPSPTNTPSATPSAQGSSLPSSSATASAAAPVAPSPSPSTSPPSAYAAGELAYTQYSALEWNPISVSAPTNLTVDTPGSCVNSPEDEENIEYFNQIEFSMDIYAVILDNGTSFSVTLSCPERTSPEFPPPTLGITMATSNGSESISCNTGEIVLTKDVMFNYPYCTNLGESCDFLFTALNTNTGVVYSTTTTVITFTNGNNTYIPNLTAATLPICNNTFDAAISNYPG